MFHGHSDYSQKPPLGGRINTKLGDHGTPNAHNRWFILFLSWVRTWMNRNSLQYHLVEGLVTYDFTLHSRVRDHTTWFWRCVRMAIEHSFGLSQFQGHNSWLACGVALSNRTVMGYTCIAVINLPHNKLHHMKEWKERVAIWDGMGTISIFWTPNQGSKFDCTWCAVICLFYAHLRKVVTQLGEPLGIKHSKAFK